MKKKRNIVVVCNNKICKTTNINYVLTRDETTKRLDIVVNVSIYVFIIYRAIFLGVNILHGYSRSLGAPIQININYQPYKTKKNVEPICHSFHYVRPSHCPVNRNEQRRKPHADVLYMTKKLPNNRKGRIGFI